MLPWHATSREICLDRRSRGIYMKRKGREHRERRRVAALAAQAQAEREKAESQ